MKRKNSILLLALLLACSPGVNGQASNNSGLGGLMEKGAELEKDNGEVYAVVLSDSFLTREDAQAICRIESVSVIDLYGVNVRSGTLEILSGCPGLSSIRFSDETTLPVKEIPSLRSSSSLISISFGGDSYGDDIMRELASLGRLSEIYIQGNDEGSGGALTVKGIQAFAKARVGSKELKLTLQNHRGITDEAFKFFAQIKGLDYIDLGSFSGVTPDGIENFYDEMESQGRTVKVILDGI